MNKYSSKQKRVLNIASRLFVCGTLIGGIGGYADIASAAEQTYINGAEKDIDGNWVGNSAEGVTVDTDSTLGTVYDGGDVYSGSSDNITVNGGVVGNVTGIVHSNYGEMSSNTVTINDGTVHNVVGGLSGVDRGYIDYCFSKNNKVVIKGGSVHDVVGGLSKKRASMNNTVDIEGIYNRVKIEGSIFGGLSEKEEGNESWNDYSVSGNKVHIKAADITGDVYGGDNNTVMIHFNSSCADNNQVMIEDAKITGNIYGGYAGNTEAIGAITENEIVIRSGYITGNVYGGYGDSNKGYHNKVTITGGAVEGSVYGYYNVDLYVQGPDDNTINLVGIDGNIDRAYTNTGIITINKIITNGSNLNIYGKDVSVGTINTTGSQGINFYIQDGLKYGDTMLDVTGNSITDISNTEIAVIVEGEPQANGDNKTINLMRTNAGITWKSNPVKDAYDYSIVLKDGAAFTYWDDAKNSIALGNNNKDLVLSLGAENKPLETKVTYITGAESDGSGYVWFGNTSDGVTVDTDSSLGTVYEKGNIYGKYVCSYSDSSDDVSGGKVTIKDGDVWTVYGGYSGNSYANENIVTITGGTVSSVYGGYTSGGKYSCDNNASITDANITYDIVGGYAYAGNSDRNKVEINHSITGHNMNRICGGSVERGSASENDVIISDSVINSSVYGGYAIDLHTNANKITISDTEITGSVYGGNAGKQSNSNTIKINDSEINGSVYGGHGSQEVNENAVSISSGLVHGDVYGGRTESQGVCGYNTVNIGDRSFKKTEIEGNVFGGQSSDGDVYYNTVKIANANITGNVYGGCSMMPDHISASISSNDSVNHNMVTITDANISGDIYGGYSRGANLIDGSISNNTADNNTVIITGSTIEGSVYGGKTDSSTVSGKDNIINLVGIGGNMDGLHANAGEINISKVVTDGSILNVYGKNSNIGTIDTAGSQRINFYIQNGLKYSDTMLNITGDDITDISGTKIAVIVEDEPQKKDDDKTINLIKTSAGITWKADPVKSGDVRDGAYDYTIVKKDGATFSYWDNAKNSIALGNNNSDLILTLEGLDNPPQEDEPSHDNPSQDDPDPNATYISGAVKNDKGYWIGDSEEGVTLELGLTTGTEYTSGNIYGKYDVVEPVSDSKVTVNSGTVNGDIYGGYSEGAYADGNIVLVNGGTIEGSVYGGYAGNGSTVDNEVVVNGGTIVDSVYGGYSANSSGDSTGNTVTICGGSIKGSVYGGYGSTGTNDINLVGVGSKFRTNTANSGAITIGNIMTAGSNLNVYGKNSNVGTIDTIGSQGLNFYIQDGLKYGDTMLNITGDTVTNIDKTKINVIVENEPQKNGDAKTINLMNTSAGIIWKSDPVKSDAINNSDYDYAIVKKDGATFNYWDNDKNTVVVDKGGKNLVLALDGLEEPKKESTPDVNMGTSGAFSLIDAIEKNKDKIAAGIKNFTTNLMDFVIKKIDFHNENSVAAGMANVQAAVSGVFQASEITGTTSTAVSVVNNFSNLTTSRMSFGNVSGFAAGRGVGLMDPDSGAAAWARYVNGRDNADGMKVDGGTADYTNNYNGFVIGADFKKVGKYQSGVMVGYVDGRGSNTMRDLMGAVARWGNTEFKTYSLGYYGSIKNDDTNTMFDINYARTNSDSETDGLGAVQKFSSTSDVLSAGVTVEKCYMNENNGTKFIPYTGLRYMNINGGSYTDNLGLRHNTKKQNIFMLPVGFKLSQENKLSNGWSITPKLDVSYTWNMGNTDSSMNISVPGLTETSNLSYSVMDRGNFAVALGLEAQNKNCTYGVSLIYQKGEHQDSRKIMAEFKLTF